MADDLSKNETPKNKEPEKQEREDNLLKKYGLIAEKILKENPLEFIVNTMSNFHLGDDWIKRLLVLASYSPYVQRQDEYIHVTITGSSGKGKSSLAKALLACLPKENCVYWSGCSERYPLYLSKNAPNSLKNKILYVDDDILIDSSFIRSIKTPSKGGKIHYGTVIELTAVELIMEGTPVVIESKVHSHVDPQDRTRSLVVTVDESEEHQKQIQKFVIEQECNNKKTVNNEADSLTCQAIYKMLINMECNGVIIPEELRNKIPELMEVRQLKRFIGLMKCSAFINQMKREHQDKSIIANEEDLNVALGIYSNFLGSEIFGLDATDVKILKYLQSTVCADYDAIGGAIGRCRETAFNHVKNLAENGFVFTKKDDRRDNVFLTDNGTNVLKRLNKQGDHEGTIQTNK